MSTLDIIECSVEHRTHTSLLVTCHTPAGTFRGVLIKDNLQSNISKASYGYYAEQLPSQFKKKLKSRLGLVFDSNCDSENSDTEPVKTNLKKLKFSEIKAMRDNLISVPSTLSKPIVKSEPALVRPNVPYKSNANHNKKKIEDLTSFLKEAHQKQSHLIKPNLSDQNGSSNQGGKLKQSLLTSKPLSSKISPDLKNKSGKQQKTYAHKSNPSSSSSKVSPEIKDNPKKKQKKISDEKKKNNIIPSDQLSPKSLKLRQTILELQAEKKQSQTKTFKSNCIKQKSRPVPRSPPKAPPPPLPNSPAKLQFSSPGKLNFPPSGQFRNYGMRSKHCPDVSRTSSTSSRCSTTSGEGEGPEWPVWCPRKLALSVPKCRKGRPARFKVKYSGCKRRRESDSGALSLDEVEDNPFGIGDVVVAKRKLASGRPYWPARVLSTTGMTVCASFYQTCEKMQLSVSELEWYYEGVLEHKFYNKKNYGKGVSQLWKDALADAERDSRVGIGVTSIVWARYDDEWWPARVMDIEDQKYTLMWLDNKSIEPVPFTQVNPFLQAYCLRYSKSVSKDNAKYEGTVDKAYEEALMLALEYCEPQGPSEEGVENVGS